MRPALFALFILSSLALAQPRSAVIQSVEEPVRAKQIAEGHWFVDFGKAAFGNITITAPAGMNGQKVTVHLGEAISGSNTVHRSPGGTVRYQRHALTLSVSQPASPSLTWAPPGWMKSGWLERPAGMPEVMPFRYVEIEGAPADFTASQIRRISWAVPFDEQAASFNSSSPELDGVWDLCKYSIKATSFLGLYVDGDRERKPYEADALINQLSHYCADQRYDTARLTHEFLLANPTWPTEWQLQSVMLGWLDFLWSGDDASLRMHYDTLKSRAMINRRTSDGLFRGYLSRGKSPWLEDIVDWPAGERDGYDMSVESKSVVIAFHYQALVLLEKIATHLGKIDDAREFAALAQATYKTFNARLWDEARGCYLDGLNPSTGAVSTHASAHASFFPLALGLVPPERVSRVAAFLKSRGMVCSVYGSQFLIEALYEAGEADLALSLLTTNQLRSWRNMSENVGSTITLEAWDPKLKPNLDWNHAWGAAPANLIPRCLMGIEPLEPGFKRFRIRPQTASLTQASLKMPTPKGPITLSVRNPSGSEWSAEIEVPPGTVAEFHLPTTQSNEVKLSSGKPKPLRNMGGRVVIELPAGSHRLSAPAKLARPDALRTVPN
jgi:alpha-L-rhamnosidase